MAPGRRGSRRCGDKLSLMALEKPVPLADARWRYVDKRRLDDYRAEDWDVLVRQRKEYYDAQLVDQVLRLLTQQKDDPGYVYTVNNYYHCLQTATRMLRDDLPEEDVVVGLFHDVGFITCNQTHGEFAAALLRPFISEKNHWMLVRHAVFQQYHCYELDGCDRHQRDKWKGHPYFDWTVEFVAKYDQRTINYDEEILPLETFEPMVRRFFSKKQATIVYE